MRVSARGCSSRSIVDRLALRLRHHHRHDLVHEAAFLDGRDRALVRSQRELVLLLARHAASLGDVLAGLTHRVGVVHLGQVRVGEAPAEGRVEHLARAALVGGLGLGHDVRRAGHRLDAAGNERVAVAGHDRVGGRVDRLESGAAQPIDRLAGDLDRKAGKQRGHAGHVPVVLAGLVGAAEDHVLELARLDARSLDRGLDRDRGKIVRPDARECTAVPANRGADGAHDPRFAQCADRALGSWADCRSGAYLHRHGPKVTETKP